MRDNYRRSALFVALRVCLLCAIECQKLPTATALELREKTAGDATHNNAMRLCIYVLYYRYLQRVPRAPAALHAACRRDVHVR